MEDAVVEAAGYAALLATGTASPPPPRFRWGAWLWPAGLSAAAALAWQGLVAHPTLRLIVTGYIAVEGAFYAWSQWRLRCLGRVASLPGPYAERLAALYERFLELRDVLCIRDFLSAWFLGAPFDVLRRGNVEDFMAYGFHGKVWSELSDEEAAAARAFVRRVEATWGVRFEEGYTHGLPFMAHAWEPLRVYHKPLTVFVVTETLTRAAHALMLLMGFRPARQGRFTYWVAPPLASEWASAPPEGLLSPPLSPRPLREDAALRRHSTSEAVGAAVHHAADAVQHVADHALDDILTVTSAAAAAVAVQHPHGGLSPRAPSPLPPRPVSPAPAAGEAGRRRPKADSAFDFGSDARDSMAPAGPGGSPVAAAGRSRGSKQPPQAAALRPSDSAASAATATPFAAAAAQPAVRPDVPIVFLHGVGFGVLPYLHLVREIQHACGTTMVLIEVPHVSLRLCWEALGVDDVAHAVAAVLERRGYRHACIVGHSYGTFVASRLCQLHPKVVHSVCLLDPVAMMTCHPQLLANFIYREPGLHNLTSVDGVVDTLRFLCSRDLTIGQAFCRKFLWTELMLWPHDLPPRALVVLGGCDDLVPAQLVQAQLKLAGHPAKVMHHPDLGHGGILLAPAFQAEFVRGLLAMLAPPPPPARR